MVTKDETFDGTGRKTYFVLEPVFYYLLDVTIQGAYFDIDDPINVDGFPF